MKKLILVFAVLLTTTLTASAFGPKLGVTGGYNLSWTKVNSSAFRNMVDGKSGAGWFIGPKVDLDLLLVGVGRRDLDVRRPLFRHARRLVLLGYDALVAGHPIYCA